MLINYFLSRTQSLYHKNIKTKENPLQFNKLYVSFVQFFAYIIISFASVCVVAFDINPRLFLTTVAAIYTVDLLFVCPETAFHHICIITIAAISGIASMKTMIPYFRILVATEISSIFFNTRRLMDTAEMDSTDGFICNNHKRTNTTSIIRLINTALFIVTFFKFQIVDMYQLLISNPVMYRDINLIIIANNLVVYFLYIGIYGLFVLNVYWGFLIVKNVYADLVHNGWIVDSARSCEFLTQYTYAASASFAIYAYQYSCVAKDLVPWQLACLICMDVAGIFTVVFTSYRFHRSCYKGILAEGFNDFNMASTMKRRNAFAYDIGAIKIRSLLCVCAKMMAAPVYRISVLNKILLIGLSAMVNIVTYIFAMKEWFTPNGYTNKELFVVFYSEKDKYTKDRKRYISILNGVGIILDTVLTALFVNDVRLLAFHYTTFLVVALISVLQPFGKMSHFWLHCTLTIQTMSLCRLNIESAIHK
jgi:hypothetical protein